MMLFKILYDIFHANATNFDKMKYKLAKFVKSIKNFIL